MVKGQAQKIETLSDGSVKLSIYVNKENIQQAVAVLYQEVLVSLPSEGSADLNRTKVLVAMRNSLDLMTAQVEDLKTTLNELTSQGDTQEEKTSGIGDEGSGD